MPRILKTLGVRLISLCSTRKGRRMLAVTSAAVYMHTVHKGGEISLGTLNEKMKLSTNDNALMLGVTTNVLIWQDSELEHTDMSSGHDSIAKKLLNNMPDWLRYGRFSDMEEDFEKVVELCMD